MLYDHGVPALNNCFPTFLAQATWKLYEIISIVIKRFTCLISHVGFLGTVLAVLCDLAIV